MPLDPSIFTNYANIRANQNAQLGANIGNAIENVQRQRMFNQAQELEQKRYDEQMALKREELSKQGLDLDKLIQPVLIKAASGQQLSPQDQAVWGAYNMMGGTKVAQNPVTGELYSPFKPLQMGGEPRGFNYPVVQQPVVESSPLGAAPMEGSTTGAQGGLDMTNILPSGASPKTMQTAQEEVVKANVAQQAENTKAATEKQRERPNYEKSLLRLGSKFKNTSAAIDEALSLIGPTTAGKGAIIKDIPLLGKGTKSKDLEAALDTIGADAAFGQLQEIRDNSKTGGALGSVSERELDLLQSSVAALKQDQRPETLRANLIKYANDRKQALERVAEAYKQDYGTVPQEITSLLEGNAAQPAQNPKLDALNKAKRVYDNVTGQYGKFVNGQFVPE